MTEYERMKHVLITLDYSNRRLNDETIDYTKLINESRNKVANILNKRKFLLTAFATFKAPLVPSREKKITPDIVLTDNSNQSLHDHFRSMVNLTNYLFYDILSPKVSTSQMSSIFILDTNEKANIEYFAKEIDDIQEELLGISETVRSLQENYKIYCENLLAFIDQKDALFDSFLDYYEEYFVSDQLKNEENVVNASNKASSIRKPIVGRRKSDKSEPKKVTYEHNEEDEKDEKKDEEEEEGIVVHETPKKKRSNLVRRKSSVYMYGVPTENRFSILSKTDTGTLIRHF